MKSKIIIVTGGTRGIGAAIVNKLTCENTKIIVTGKNEQYIDNLKKKAAKNIIYKVLDMNCNKSTLDFCKYIDSLERVDVLINNAGINKISRIEDIMDDDFEDVLSVNLRGPFYLSRHASKKMINAGGRIINIASIWSVISKEGRVSYSTAKSALGGLTRGLSADLAKYDILVNSVSPGFVKTELTASSLTETEVSNLCEQIPAGRLAEPEEIANVVEFLSSMKNSYLTGQNIIVDGGFTNV